MNRTQIHSYWSLSLTGKPVCFAAPLRQENNDISEGGM